MGIVQITVGGARYSAPATRCPGRGHWRPSGTELAGRYDVAIALHTDHCPPEHLDGFLRPLLASSRERVERGDPPLLHSHSLPA